MKVTTYTATGTKGSTTLNDKLVGATVNSQALAQAVRVYLSNARQGTAVAQTRSDVRLTKRKIYRQKGTGNARHGAKSAPLFVGGGVAHGPKAETHWSKNLSARLKKIALLSALSAQKEHLYVVDAIEKLEGSTKKAAQLVAHVSPNQEKTLVVLSDMLEKPMRALRNIPHVTLVQAKQLTALDVARANTIVLTLDTVAILEARLLGTKEVLKKETAVVGAKKTAASAKSSKEAKATTTKVTKKSAAKKTTTSKTTTKSKKASK